MHTFSTLIVFRLGLALLLGTGLVSAKPNSQPAAPLSAAGEGLQTRYADTLSGLQAEISKALPKADERNKAALQRAREAAKKAAAEAAEAEKNLGSVHSAKGLVDHAKGKWIGGAEKGLAQAQGALKAAKSPAEREAAQQDLARWQANKEEGLQALKERQAAYDKAKTQEPRFRKAHETAQAALVKARQNEMNAANALLADLAPVLATDKHDAKLVKCALLAHAAPRGLAEFAQQGPDQAALVDQLLGDAGLMQAMLVAGGARFGEYGRAMEIYTAIRKASAKSHSGNLQRLALATSLEHARPIKQSAPADSKDPSAVVDPVKRYLHYEQAFLDGELDPAFKDLGTWEYRFVVNCDSPDEILAWGREMLRNYRPDHIYNPDYGWRYVSSVRTEVPYGSQNVQYDDPARHQYQNIIRNGGVCGRRAFYGRFILRAFGIPTWGVTQRAHAALSHWTPKGWVINLGAGFNASWWDKDDVSLSGTQFHQESQARAHGDHYLSVLRAQWVSQALGEPTYNERRKVEGGFWSGMANYMASMLASKKAALGPLGQELGEANEKEQKVNSAAVSKADQQVQLGSDGIIAIPAVAHGKSSGKAAAMKGYSGGMQLHALGGFKTEYVFEAPKAGAYQLVARVATVQTGQKFLLSANKADQPAETDVPYTLGLWQHTQPVEVSLVKGRNTLHFQLKEGSRGVTIKDFILKPVN